METTDVDWKGRLAHGLVIPALPLTLHADGGWSRRHQQAVLRYYIDAGAGGVAVGVHATQFEIRDPQHGLLEPVLRLAAETLDRFAGPDFVRIAGICGPTQQARAEAELTMAAGYHAGLLSLTAFREASESAALEHCRAIAQLMPIVGFYLQPAVGGRMLSYRFWREFCEIENVLAIKIAPFNRYFTCDVVRAVIESGRDDIALYTGNDDNIIVDLLTPFSYRGRSRYIVGGLLGQWGVWTRRAVEMFQSIQRARQDKAIAAHWLTRAAALTDANAAVFDAAHNFAGCLPGVLEVLCRQGLAPSNRCLNPQETLSPGQAQELDRVCGAYPELLDNDFVQANLARWLDDAP